MKIYYRLSDLCWDKPRMQGVNRVLCFDNFVWAFDSILNPASGGDPRNMLVIADRCKESLDGPPLLGSPFPFICTELGCHGSYVRSLEMAASQDDVCYLVEHDYIHRPEAAKLILEGLSHADYVTLYDHPDKYTAAYGYGETSKVWRTRSSHWRYTVSTCHTFAATPKTIRKDMDIWRNFFVAGADGFAYPHDHVSFVELGKRGRKVAVCIPGAACHTNMLAAPELGERQFDDWALAIVARAKA